MANTWSAAFASGGDKLTVTPMSWNMNIPVCSTIGFGYCAVGAGRPTIESATLMTGDDRGVSVCGRWKSDRNDLSEGGWVNGDAGTCHRGDIGGNGRANALRLVNLYRCLVGLGSVHNQPQDDEDAQQEALIYKANPSIWGSHCLGTPGPGGACPCDDNGQSLSCWTQPACNAAQGSNLAQPGIVAGIDGFMNDTGSKDATGQLQLGHRRWMLSQTLQPNIGLGSTGDYSSLRYHSLDLTTKRTWVAWPPDGYLPAGALTVGGTTLDATGWSVHSNSIDFKGQGATVTLTMSDGQNQPTPLPVDVTYDDGAYRGSNHAIMFKPPQNQWATTAGKSYHVTINSQPVVDYAVKVVDCP
jgi:hypothetical protein